MKYCILFRILIIIVNNCYCLLFQGLFHIRREFLLTVNFYADIMPALKEYTLFFQGIEPRCHLLYDMQVKTTRTFLSYFVKPEFIPTTGEDLATFSVDDDVLAKRRDMYMGDAAKKVSSVCLIFFYLSKLSASSACQIMLFISY